MTYANIKLPDKGQKISIQDDQLLIPSNPIIGFVEGDGIGPDITRASLRVLDAAVNKAYGGQRKIHWCELYLGEKAATIYDGDYFPDETLEAIKELIVSIKGPLTTPVGGGFRSLNVSLRQTLDLYACVRPVRYYAGVPSPMRRPEEVDVVIFRENTEDVYAGIEYRSGTEENRKLARFLREEMGAQFFEGAALGVKPISAFGSKRLIRKAIQYAITNGRESVTLVHKGNIMKFTEGGFRNWGYELAQEEFKNQVITEEALYDRHNGKVPEGKIVIKDRIADIMFQLLQLRPAEFDVLATMNLNGDYLSDAVAAEVGGIGIAPGANMADHIAVFEATHGTAPKYANLDKVNPSSLLFSGVMMLEYIGWNEAADLINAAFPQVIADKTVTYDFARQMDGALTVSTSGFGDALVAKITGTAEDLARLEQARRQALAHERQQRETQRASDPIQSMKASGRQPATAAGVMSTLVSVPSDTTVEAAMRQMRASHISSILVEPDAGRNWGIMTQRDIITKIIGANKSLHHTTVDAIATRPLIKVSTDATLQELAGVMIAQGIRRVVVAAKEKPVGIVSDTDLFNIVQEFGWGDED
jgi:isocitrate dehydrogenase